MNPQPGTSASSWIDDAPMPPPVDPHFGGAVPPFPPAPFPPASTAPSTSPDYPINIKRELISPPSHMVPPEPFPNFAPGGTRQFPENQGLSSQRVKQELMYHIQQRSARDEGPNPLRLPTKQDMDLAEAETTGGRRTVHVVAEASPNFVVPKRDYAENWVEALFFELDDPEPHGSFGTTAELFHIDGLTKSENFDPQPNRFCLGSYVVQTPLIAYVKQVGKGVEIKRDEMGNVVLTNVSKSTVFVQCANYASKVGDPNDTVYRLGSFYKEPNISARQIMIFDAARFNMTLRGIRDQTDLTSLSQYCFTKISFIKGFGSKYLKRADITDCEIWVELKLIAPLAEIDKKFEQLFPIS